MLKQERDDAKHRLFRKQIKFQNSVSQAEKLDKEIEEVLGRAVTNGDLQMLYKLDL